MSGASELARIFIQEATNSFNSSIEQTIKAQPQSSPRTLIRSCGGQQPVIPITEVNLARVPRALEGEVMGGSSLEGAGKGRLWRKGSRKGVDGGAQRVNALLSHLSCL
jgi:hypothetical protein